MQYRVFASIGLAASGLTFISLVEAPLGAQAQGTSKPWSAPSTPDGRPDIDGVWSFAINVPFQRPAPGEKGGLTDQEQAELEFRASTDEGATWTRAWTGRVPLQRIAEPIFEYACHEANLGMEGILKGTRAEERLAGERKPSR